MIQKKLITVDFYFITKTIYEKGLKSDNEEDVNKVMDVVKSNRRIPDYVIEALSVAEPDELKWLIKFTEVYSGMFEKLLDAGSVEDWDEYDSLLDGIYNIIRDYIDTWKDRCIGGKICWML